VPERAGAERAEAPAIEDPHRSTILACMTSKLTLPRASGASLALRRPVEQYGGTGRRLELRERREATPEAGSAGREAGPARSAR
jgi:hypothetical protein